MCGRLVNLDTVARVLAEYYHLKTETQLAALDEALSKVPAVSVGGGHGKDHFADHGNMVGDTISRAEAIEAIKEDKIDLTDPNVVAVFKATRDFEKVETQVMTCDRHIKILKDLPSAQPDIVACGDCIHWICHDRRCGYWNHGVKPLDWCCHAERRTDG